MAYASLSWDGSQRRSRWEIRNLKFEICNEILNFKNLKIKTLNIEFKLKIKNCKLKIIKVCAELRN